MRFAFFASLIALAGCTEEVAACSDPDELFDGTECVPAGGMDAGPGDDAGGPDDGGPGEDTGSDAGACFEIECGDEVCNPADGICVECLQDADCGDDPTRPDCDEGTNRCEPGCGAVGCDHVPGFPHCSPDETRCVACQPASEATDCGDRACDPRTLDCTDTDRGALELCQPCRASSECGEVIHMGSPLPMRCSQTVGPGASDLGFACLVDFAAAGSTCPDGTRRIADDTMTVEGDAGTACTPVRTTTCAALLDDSSCMNALECGAEGHDDSACVLETCESLCTSADDDRDCPGDQTCANVAGAIWACSG